MFVSLLLFVLMICLVVSVANKCDRTFKQCSFRCHCKNNEQCDSVTGECPNGCDDMWMGPSCQYRDVYTVQNTNKLHDHDIETCLPSNRHVQLTFNDNSQRHDNNNDGFNGYLPTGLILYLKRFEGRWSGFKVKISNSGTNGLSTCYDHPNEFSISEIYTGSSTDLDIAMIEINIEDPKRSTIMTFDFYNNANPCEIYAFTGREVAFNHPTTATSTFRSWISGNAVNGIFPGGGDNEIKLETSCFQSGIAPNWKVNLGRGYDILDVNLYHRYPAIGIVRLVGSTREFQGRVELYHNRIWGTVCDDSWDNNDAKVVCRQLALGTEQARSYSQALYGEGTAQIWLDDVACHGTEVALLNCGSSGIGVHNCQHYEDASVRCISNPYHIDTITADGTSKRFYDGQPMQDRHPLKVIHDSPTKDQQYIRVAKGGEALTICELTVFAECPVDFCGWNCEIVCKCVLPPVGLSKILGRCLACKNRWYSRKEGHCSVECDRIHWGKYCDQLCGHCETNTCDFLTGHCDHSCTGHYKFPLCVDVCDGHTWGNNCSKSCGHCEGARQCDPELGHCSRCEPFWRPPFCDMECHNNEWGQQCEHACGHCEGICDRTDGHCEHGCTGTWKRPLCVDECDAGTYGRNCDGTCGHCEDDNPCDIQTGNCHRCEPGWKLPLCQIDCDSGTFGAGCSGTCGHCKQGVTCYARNGYCPAGCDGDWAPPKCSTGGPVVTDRNRNYTCMSWWQTVTCDVDCPVWGVPEPYFIWNKKEGPRKGETFTFEGDWFMLTKADAGVYECTASIGAASVSVDVTLTVMYPPINTAANGSRTDFVVGQRLLLNCPFDCIPYPTFVTWYKISSTGSERMQQNKSKTAKGMEYTTLVIDKTTKDDGTTFRCDVYYEHQDSGVRKGEYFITTIVKYGPEVTGENNTLRQFVVGDNIQLNCPIDAFPPPELTWYKDGTILPNGDDRLEINDGTLMINGCVTLDLGVYACVGHSDIKPFIATYTIRLSEKFGPRLTTKEKNKTVLALYGHHTVLSCPIEAVPAPTYTWYKDTAKDSMHSSNKNSMEITRFGPDDVGMYKCEANNSVTPFTMTYNISLVRKYAPVLTNPDGNNSKPLFLKGRSQTFDCPIEGVPLPTLTWYKHATKLTSGGRFVIYPLNSSLKITNFVSEDAGVYKCVGENIVPPAATYIVTLVEEFAPRLTTTEPRRKVLALITEDVVLSCPIEGYPPPEFTWYKDDGNVTNSRRMTLNGATLHITSFLKTDEGQYSCKAKNNVSNVTVTYDIDLIEKFGPRLPVNHGNYEEDEFKVGGDTAIWRCPIVGNPPATLSWYKQSVPFTDERVIIGSHGVTLTLTNTVKRDAGNYSCIGRNNVPPYNATYYIILREIMAPFLTSSETEIQTVFTAGEPHSYVCPVDGYPKPVITWYKNPYNLKTENFTGEIIEMQADTETIFFEDIDGNAGGGIYFINATLDDVGVYTCVGRNRVPPYNISYVIDSMEKSLVKYPDFDRKMQSGTFVFVAFFTTLCTFCSFLAANYFYDRRFGPEDDNNESEFVIDDKKEDVSI